MAAQVRNSLFVASLLATIAAPAFAAALQANSKIDAVTVYPDAAIVTRIAELDVPEGESTVGFAGLPTSLDPASLRVEAMGEARIEIGGLESGVQALDPKAANDAFAAKMTALLAERDRLAVAIQALQGERAMILRFSQSGPDKLGPDSKPLAIADWQGAWSAIHDGLAKVDAELRPAEADSAKVEAQIRVLQGEQSQAAQATQRLANVALLARGAGHATFKLSYRIQGVGWRPAYDASLDATTNRGEVALTRRALIAQRSGEDWRDVALTVSTARVAQATGVAALETLHVDFWQPVEADAMRAAPMAAGGVAAKSTAPAAPAPLDKPKVLEQSVEVTSMARGSAYAADFLAPGRVTILADGTQRSIALLRSVAKAALTIKTAPAQDTAAYLEAKFPNDGDAPVLPGEVSILRDGAFIGLGAMPFVAPGDNVTLGFGADDRVKVTRAPVTRKENEPTWFNQSKVATMEFKTNVKNLHPVPVNVQVVDQLPVSQNTSIVVDLSPVTTAPTDKQVNGKPGVLGWSLDLAPNEAKDVRFAYRLKWPGDHEIGLDGTLAPLAVK